LNWFGVTHERLEIDETAGIVEGTLDALETALEKQASGDDHLPARPNTQPKQAIDPPALDEPSFDESPRPRARQASEVPGGVGVGVSAELFPIALFALGPRLDVGLGSGGFVLFISEGLRDVLGAEHDALLFDVQLGLGYGAPFVPQSRIGFMASGGFEWFSAVPSGGRRNSRQTDMSVILTGGVRSRWRLQAVALWVGLDVKGRLAPQRLLSPIDLMLPHASALLSVGGILLVAGSDKEPR
jgi:hypothetical protein